MSRSLITPNALKAVRNREINDQKLGSPYVNPPPITVYSDEELKEFEEKRNDVLFYNDLIKLTGIAREEIQREYLNLKYKFHERHRSMKTLSVEQKFNEDQFQINYVLLRDKMGKQYRLTFNANYGDVEELQLVKTFEYDLYVYITTVSELRLYMLSVISRSNDIKYKYNILKYCMDRLFLFGVSISDYSNYKQVEPDQDPFTYNKLLMVVEAFYTIFDFSLYMIEILQYCRMLRVTERYKLLDLIFNEKSKQTNEYKISSLSIACSWGGYKSSDDILSHIITSATWIDDLDVISVGALIQLGRVINANATQKVWNRLYVLDRDVWNEALNIIFRSEVTNESKSIVIEPLLQDTTHTYLFNTLNQQLDRFEIYYNNNRDELKQEIGLHASLQMYPLLHAIFHNKIYALEWVNTLVEYIEPFKLRRFKQICSFFGRTSFLSDFKNSLLENEFLKQQFVINHSPDLHLFITNPNWKEGDHISDQATTFVVFPDLVQQFIIITRIDDKPGIDKETAIEILLLNFTPLYKPIVEQFKAKVRRIVYEIYGTTPKQLIASQFRKKGTVRSNESKEEETGSKRGKTENYMDDVVSFAMITLTAEDVSISTQMSDVD